MTDWRNRLSVDEHDSARLPLWGHIVAGSLAGAVEHFVTFPFDAWTTRKQSGLTPSFEKLLTSPRAEIRSLFRGCGAAVAGAVPSHAAMFTVLEKGGERLEGVHGGTGLTTSLAVLIHDLISVPIHVAVSKVQAGEEATASAAFKSAPASLRTIVKLYSGLPLSVMSKLPETWTQNVAQRSLEKIFNVDGDWANQGKVWGNLPLRGAAMHFIVSGLAGSFASGLTTPLSVVQHRLEAAAHDEALKDVSPVEMTRELYQKEGIRGFFVGAVPRACQAFPESALSWGTYEIVELLLRRRQKKNCK